MINLETKKLMNRDRVTKNYQTITSSLLKVIIPHRLRIDQNYSRVLIECYIKKIVIKTSFNLTKT